MSMKLERRPQAARRIHPEVLKEVRAAYHTLGEVSAQSMEDIVDDWDEPPVFDYKVTVTKKRWTLIIKYDKRTTGGKHFKWVDEGTGKYVPGGSEYVITSRYPGGKLSFDLPSMPKTIPASGIPSPSSQAPPGSFAMVSVVHPGIDPRHLSKPLYDLLKSRNPGSFRNVTEAAIKRAFRRLGIHT